MSIRVTVNSVPKNRVSINTRKQETVRSVGVGVAQRLDALTDVVVDEPKNNELLVYDENLGKFVTKDLPSIVGGTF